jgi:hypothetical protein
MLHKNDLPCFVTLLHIAGRAASRVTLAVGLLLESKRAKPLRPPYRRLVKRCSTPFLRMAEARNRDVAGDTISGRAGPFASATLLIQLTARACCEVLERQVSDLVRERVILHQ